MLKILAKAQTMLWDPKHILTDLKKDTEGATMIEYSLLIGLITVAMIASLVFVGIWVTNQWGALKLAITPVP